MTATTIRVSEPRDLLAYLPYRLGFRPHRSAVVVSLRGERGRVGLVARIDLDALADPQAGASLANHVWRDGAQRAVLVIYDEAGAEQGEQVRAVAVDNVLGPLEALVGPTQVWLVAGDRYFAWDCTDPRCCPLEGWALGDLASTQVAAEMVFSGATVAEHRGAVTEVLPASKKARYNVRRVSRRWAQRGSSAEPGPELAAWRVESLRAWFAVVDHAARGVDAPPRLLGRLDAGLRDRLVRDAVIMSLAVGPSQAERSVQDDPVTASKQMSEAFGSIFDPRAASVPDPVARASWCAALRLVAAHCEPTGHAPVLALLGLLSWWGGDGAAANCWVARALEAEPGYRLAELLGSMLDAALPPGWVRRAAAHDAALG